MRGSLQEQLLQAGLVKKKPPKKKHQRAPEAHKAKTSEPPRPAVEVKKVLADHELDKPLKLQIKQLLKENRVNHKEAEIPYNYPVGSQIKRCYVTQEQSNQLGEGSLAIVNWNDRSYLIPESLVAELLALHPDLKLYVNRPEDESTLADDPYKDFPIPDDLTW